MINFSNFDSIYLLIQNFDGMGLVHVAAHKGHVQILNWLLCFQQNLNEQVENIFIT